jgi:hypothetical protein
MGHLGKAGKSKKGVPHYFCKNNDCEAAEMDEQWSFVGNKSNQRWIWSALEHSTNTILASIFGKRK